MDYDRHGDDDDGWDIMDQDGMKQDGLNDTNNDNNNRDDRLKQDETIRIFYAGLSIGTLYVLLCYTIIVILKILFHQIITNHCIYYYLTISTKE